MIVTKTHDSIGPVYTFVCPACKQKQSVRNGGDHRCVCGATITFREDKADDQPPVEMPTFEATISEEKTDVVPS